MYGIGIPFPLTLGFIEELMPFFRKVIPKIELGKKQNFYILNIQ